MSDKVIVQYVQYLGFEVKASVREYAFNVLETSCEPREYTLSIENEAFTSHRARYQDAPGICALKLRRELAVCADHLPQSHYLVTDTELDDYRSAHAQKVRKPWGYRAQDL